MRRGMLQNTPPAEDGSAPLVRGDTDECEGLLRHLFENLRLWDTCHGKHGKGGYRKRKGL